MLGFRLFTIDRNRSRCDTPSMIRDADSVGVPTGLEEVRHEVERLVAEGQSPEAVSLLLSVVQAMAQENAGLAARVKALLKQVYGRKSEKVDPNQLKLFLEALAEGKAPEPPAPEPAPEPVVREKPKPAPHGRKPLPADLPRETVIVEPAEADRRCPECDTEKVVIGYETSEVLEYRPATFVVQEYRRQKMACPKCEEHVTVAPVPAKVVAKGLPGPGLLAQVLVSKYVDSLPLNRQLKMFSRLGVDFSSSTLTNWVQAGADLLAVVYDELVREAMNAHVLGTDDTGLKVLDRDHEHGIKKGSMWVYVGDNRVVVFQYTPDHKAAGPAAFLEKRTGFVQSDGYSGYKRIARDHPDVTWAGCLAHARRKFVEALDAGDLRAASAIAHIRDLYKVEADATAAGDTPEQRLQRRKKHAAPAMDRLGRWIRDTHPEVPPKTPLGRAVTYAVNQWASLQVYLTDGRVPIDNNSVERQLRRVAVGRRNWLFAGSDEGARRAAILFSVLGTCSLAGADPFEYLRDVLGRTLREWPPERIHELLPAAWVAKRAAAAQPPQIGTTPAS